MEKNIKHTALKKKIHITYHLGRPSEEKQMTIGLGFVLQTRKRDISQILLLKNSL